MTAVTGVVPNLINGVSRQPEAIRLNSQLEEQINGFSTVSKGLQNRPGTINQGALAGTFAGNVLVHPINRDRTERYFAVFEDGDVKVYGSDGSQKTVAYPDGKTYLNITGTPEDCFSCATNADYTFIANKEVVPIMDPTSATPAQPEEAIIFFRSVNYSRRYKIWIDDVLVANVRTPDGSATDPGNVTREEEATTPENVAKMMFWGSFEPGDALNASMLTNGYVSANADGYGDGMYESGAAYVTDHQGSIDAILTENLATSAYEIKRYGSVLYFKNLAGNPFSIRFETDTDTQNKQSIYVIRKVTSDFSDLPPFAPEGYRVKIINTDDSNDDDYFVKFEKDDADDGNTNGTWNECPGPGTTTEFDITTMPHVLVREADMTFTFRRVTLDEWTARRGGDADMDPGPSFLNQGIQGIFFARGRLGFLARENIIMSRANQFFDFWRQTMLKLVDDDPVDLAANEGPIADHGRGFGWRNNIGLLSEQSIQVLSGGQLLTPMSAKIDLAFEEALLARVTPVKTTRTMLFASASNRYGDVREAFVGDDPDNQVIGSVADHVPNYIPKGIVQMVSNSKENFMALRCDEQLNKLWVYQWYWQGDQKAQSAWHRWEFDSAAEILGMAFFDDELFLVIRRGTTLYIEKIIIASDTLEDNGLWNIRLDRKDYQAIAAGVYSNDTGKTTFTVPYTIDANYIVVEYGGTRHGIPAKVYTRTSNTIVVDGNWSGVDVVIGRQFTFEFTLNRQYFTVSGNGSFKALERQRLQILRHVYQCNDTAYFRVEVTPHVGASVRTVHYTSLRSGDASSNNDVVNLLDDPVRVPINAKSERAVVRVVNDTHYPNAFNGIEWEGMYQERAKRVA